MVGGGFCHAVGTFGTGVEFRAVWLSNCSLDVGQGVKGEALLDVDACLIAAKLPTFE